MISSWPGRNSRWPKTSSRTDWLALDTSLESAALAPSVELLTCQPCNRDRSAGGDLRAPLDGRLRCGAAGQGGARPLRQRARAGRPGGGFDLRPRPAPADALPDPFRSPARPALRGRLQPELEGAESQPRRRGG